MNKNKEEKTGKDSWGIWDDSSDLHRALSLSDGYYGDWSSLVALYVATGKSVVIQDVNSVGGNVIESRNLMFADFTMDDDGNAWAFELFHDGLFKLDFIQHTAQLVANSGCFSKEKGKNVSSHRYIYLAESKSKVVCFPYFLDRIMIYNIKNKDVKFIEIDSNYIVPDCVYSGFAFSHIIEFNNKYYVFGYQSTAILVMDKFNQIVSYQKKIFEKISVDTYDNKKSRYPLYISKPTKDGWVKILLYNTNEFFNYNLISQKYEIIQKNMGIRDVDLAEFSEGSLWLFNSNKKILLEWNISQNAICTYKLECKGFKTGKEGSFSAICNCGDKLLLFPSFSNMVICFDKKECCFSNFLDLPVPNDDTITFKYDRPKKIGNKIFAFARFNSTIYEIDTKSGKISNHVFKFAENDISWTMDFFKIPIDVNDGLIDGKAGGRIHEYTKIFILK